MAKSFAGKRRRMQNLWRGGLSERRTAPLGREAALKPAIAVFQVERISRF
jgi:hypothetical protein